MHGWRTHQSRALALGAAALAITAVAGGRAEQGAGIEILSKTNSELSLKFTDSQNAQLTIQFEDKGQWRPQTEQSSPAGIIFGNNEPQFASAAALRLMGITPQQAVQTFNSTIRNRPMDDITIYQLHDGEMAIALWQEDVITELWFVGSFFSGYKTDRNAASVCEQSFHRCCNQNSLHRGSSGFTRYPKPDIHACLALISTCGPTYESLACECVRASCEWRLEEEINLAHSHQKRQVETALELGEQACEQYKIHCGAPPTETEQNAPVIALLGEALNRIQAIIDSR